jgi:light-regulated signal transduction histidine kinase (bacteriophytochrome)
MEEYYKKLDNEGRRLLDVIAGNTRKMGLLIDDLLAFSRLGRQQMAFAPVDMALLANAVFMELKSQEKERHIEFKVGALPAAFGDRAMLRQVLQNLLANAVKFTCRQARARIELGARTEKGETIYHVRDNGVGFDMAYAHKLFGVFQRLHGADEFEGTGVGLALVQRIVQRHGGRVWAESGAMGGATFFFSLPTEAGDGIEDEAAGTKRK